LVYCGLCVSCISNILGVWLTIYSVYPISLVYAGLCIFFISNILGIWWTLYILYIQYAWYMLDYLCSVYPISLVYGGLCISCTSNILGIWVTMHILYIQYPWYMMDYVYPVHPISLVYGWLCIFFKSNILGIWWTLYSLYIQIWKLWNTISFITIGWLIWRLITKREQASFNLEIKKKVDQALIPISTIKKFPAQYSWYMVDYTYPLYPISLVYGRLCISCILNILGIWWTMHIL